VNEHRYTYPTVIELRRAATWVHAIPPAPNDVRPEVLGRTPAQSRLSFDRTRARAATPVSRS
jgi:hypothetical protein